MEERAVVYTDIYARQSLGNKDAIEDQIIECREDVTTGLGWTVLKVFKDGKSASEYAKHGGRTDWSKVLERIESGDCQILTIWEVSRASRKFLDEDSWNQLLSLGRRKGLLIRVTNRDRTYDLTRADHRNELMRLAIEAAEDSDKRSKWVERGVKSSFRRGRPPTGHVPKEYAQQRDSLGKVVNWTVNEENAARLREAYERVAEGTPMRQLENLLGVTAPTIRKKLRNPVYKGVRRITVDGEVKEKHGIWPAIVDDELWDRANKVLDGNAKDFRPASVRMLLTRAVRCGECGDWVKGDGMTRNGYLGPRYGCRKGCVWFEAEEAEKIVKQLLIKVLSRPDYQHEIKAAMDADTEETKALNLEIRDLETKLEGHQRNSIAGTLHPDDAAAITTGIRARIRDLNARKSKANVPGSIYAMLADDFSGSEEDQAGIRRMEEHGLFAMERLTNMAAPEVRALIRDVLDIQMFKVQQKGGKRLGVRVPFFERALIRIRGREDYLMGPSCALPQR
ncbi:recombinase family protein [Glycomyces sp. NPDC021274]|uniref:recombinase family protein n=1 Tax=Glycomyces sp. NPDC021274 TaxID=3155120 RepID=UPI0033C7B9D3